MKGLGALGAVVLPAALALGVLQLYIDGRMSGAATLGSIAGLVVAAILVTGKDNRR